MRISLVRIANKKNYCIGRLYVDGMYVCDTIEDRDLGLDQSWSLAKIKQKKVKSKTAIPTGTYEVTLNIVSPKFSKIAYYKQFCNGRVPRLLRVPGFDGILMHIGKDERSSAGCLIVGYNTIKGKVTKSQQAFEKLYALLKNADNITIEITRKYKVAA
jgi:hypothetical protein